MGKHKDKKKKKQTKVEPLEDKKTCCCGGKPEKAEKKTSSCCCGSESEKAEKKETACCCGGGETDEGESCCCNGTNDDEPFLGEKTVVNIDYLYLDQETCARCQGTDTRVEQAIELLEPVMNMAGYTLELHREEIATRELAEEHKLESSPTVRVNGVDICPETIENSCEECSDISGTETTCRQFEFNGKLYEVAPTALVVKRALEIVFGGEEPSDAAYEMPQNIVSFFEGKEKKLADEKAAYIDAARELAGDDEAKQNEYADLAEKLWEKLPQNAAPKSESGCCCGGSSCC